MAFTTRTKRAVGTPTRKDDEDASIDNEVYLYNQFLSVVGTRDVVLNGSFESDADSDGFPDGWTRTLYTGGSFSHETSTAAADGKAIHGKRSVKFTSPGGGGNGGGYIESTDFFETTEGRVSLSSWQHKSSVAGIHNVVEITFYDSTQASISTTTLYDSTSNPTAWKLTVVSFTPPTNARYAKLRFTGAKSDNATAGSAWFDDIRLGALSLDAGVLMDESGTYKWTCPTGVTLIRAIIVGGGGGGGGSNVGNGAGGGGAGGYCKVITQVTPGTSYNFVIGAGGAGSATAAGANGGNSTLTIGATTYTANGGTGGVAGSGAGTGGAGGTATNGDVNTTGNAGGNRSGAAGGDGGSVPPFGGYGPGGPGGTAGTKAPHYGGGGGGGGNNSAGADGHTGAIFLNW